MDAFRKQLDALMGANRNGDVAEVKRNYWDRDVCRHFLCRLCPHDLFNLTKMDMGVCPKVHSLELRKDYEAARAKGKDNYERELEDTLEKHILECDRKIARALKRLEDDDANAATAIAVSEVTKSAESYEITKLINEKLMEAEELDLQGRTDDKIRAMDAVEELRQKRADKQAMLLLHAFNQDRAGMGTAGLTLGGGHAPNLMPLPLPAAAAPPLAPLAAVPPDARTQEMIEEKLKKAEELGEEGMVDEAQRLLEEAEALKKLGARVEPPPDANKALLLDPRIQIVSMTDQKLRVCDICGAFLSIYDNDRRLADHFGGKLHLGYMSIREKLREIREARKLPRVMEPLPKPVPDGRPKENEKVQVEEGEKEKEQEKEKERERDDAREKEKELARRDKDKEKERERERDRDRDRERDRDRDRDRGRERDRDRDRDYDRDRDRNRSGCDRERERERGRERDHDQNRKRSHSQEQARDGEHDRRDRSDDRRRRDRH
eukprot:SM000130S27103  [mRNA]  locus=s130:227914:232056:+ [translate_table: standard]